MAELDEEYIARMEDVLSVYEKPLSTREPVVCTRKAVVQRFGAAAGDWRWNRFTVHYTPKHGSWLNQAEIAISLSSRQCLGQRRIGDRASLRKQTRAWNRRGNRDRVMIQWSFTRKQARKKFGYKITRSRY
jgi:hypothetical protein